jgi:hypothetical protein
LLLLIRRKPTEVAENSHGSVIEWLSVKLAFTI